MISIILFYNDGNKWMIYSACRVILIAEKGAILLTPQPSSLDIKVIRSRNLDDYISMVKNYSTALSFVVLETFSAPKERKWINKLNKSCNEIVKVAAQLDLGFTVSPMHLLKLINKYDGKRNFRVLHRG